MSLFGRKEARQLTEIQEVLDAIYIMLRRVLRQEATVATDLSALIAAVEEQTTVDESLIALVEQIAAMLADQGVDAAVIAQVVDTMTANNAAVAQAVVANTPSE